MMDDSDKAEKGSAWMTLYLMVLIVVVIPAIHHLHADACTRERKQKKATYAQYRHNKLLSRIEIFFNLNGQLVHFIGARRQHEIILGVTRLGHQGTETVVRDVNEGVLRATDMGNIAIVGRGGEIFHLFVGEDIDSDEMALGVTVLAGLGGGDVDDLARAVLDHDVAVLADGPGLHGVGLGGAGIGRLEVDVVVLLVV